MDLNTPVSKLVGIGDYYKKKLKSLEIETIQDLLFYFPRRWDDFSNIKLISELRIGEQATVKGTIWKITNKKTRFKSKSWRRSRFITLATLADTTGTLKIIWFNQPYITKNLKKGDEIVLSGETDKNGTEITFINPVYEKIGHSDLIEGIRVKDEKDLTHVGRIVPVYSETAGVSSKWLRYRIKNLLSQVEKIKDFLPDEVKKSQDLLDLPEAIKQIHFPDDHNFLERAKKRLGFDEIFLIQLNFLKQKLTWQEGRGVAVKFDSNLVKKFVDFLPFKLTDSQRKAAFEILKSLESSVPQNRLLEGDVGSGKTVVATMAILMTISSGFEVAYMAPTEILATQHYQNISNLLKPFKIKINLILGSTKPKEKKEILENLKSGNLDLIIGTHALIQENVKFRNLGLAIIDEQHRFGVAQRATLRKSNLSNFNPHLLSMTATPIPRTLALALYGDLDLSIISEIPPGRPKIITKLVSPSLREKAYSFISQEVKRGRQIFVICPLIEESDKLGVKATTSEYKKLQNEIFPDLKVEMLHGKMKTKEKDEIMKDFTEERVDILVSTSVIEVGIDIPNATIMMIEGAERFGLAQLHQFRGRVGRGKHQSYCLLFTESSSFKSYSRLKALISSSDGFKLAEEDLRLRGPGEIYGFRQHGLPDLKMASLTDIFLIKEAKKEAEKILKKDPKLSNYPELKKATEGFVESRHIE